MNVVVMLGSVVVDTQLEVKAEDTEVDVLRGEIIAGGVQHAIPLSLEYPVRIFFTALKYDPWGLFSAEVASQIIMPPKFSLQKYALVMLEISSGER